MEKDITKIIDSKVKNIYEFPEAEEVVDPIAIVRDEYVRPRKEQENAKTNVPKVTNSVGKRR